MGATPTRTAPTRTTTRRYRSTIKGNLDCRILDLLEREDIGWTARGLARRLGALLSDTRKALALLKKDGVVHQGHWTLWWYGEGR